MKDPCKPSTSVKVLRNVVKIKTGKKTKLTKRNICEVFTDIKTGKLPLPPLVLTRDRSYLLDKKSPFTSGEYDKLFDKTSSRAVLKRLAEKVNIKKVDTLTKSQLVDAILKRLQFLNISEPVKLSAAVSSPTAAPTPKVTVITKPKQIRKGEFIPAVRKSGTMTNKDLIGATPQNTVPTPPQVNSRVSVAPEQGKVILGDRNYDLLFDPKTKKSELIRIAKKVNVENVDNMTRKELIEATTKRLRFMTNRGLTRKAPVPFAPNKPPVTSTPSFFPKAPNRPPVTTTPSFLQVKPKAPTPDTGLLNYSRGGANAKGGSFLNFSNGGKKNTNVPNFLKKANVPSVPKKVNAPNAKKGKSFLNFFRGGKKNSNAPSVPKKVNASNAKKGKSFFNYFKGGKKKNVNVKPNSGTLPPNVKPNKIENNKINNMTEELINNAVNNEISNSVRKKQLNDEAKRQNRAKNKNNNNFNATKELNKQLNNEAKRQNRAKNKNTNNFNAGTEFNKQMAIRNVTDELITRAVNNEISNSVRKKQLNNEAKRQNRAKNKNNNNFNAGTEFNKQMAIRNVTDVLITRAVNDEIVNSMRKNINNTTTNTKLNNATKNMILSINKATTLKELRKIFLKGTLKLHPNKGGNEATFKIFMNAHNKKKNLLNSGNTKKNDVKINNMTQDLVNNAVNEELTTEIVNEINAGPVTDEIIDDLVSKIINETPVMRLGGRAAEPNQLTNDILTNVEQDVSKEIVTTFNNPLFNNKRTTINNPLFNNKKDGSEELSNYINNLGLQNENKQKLMSLFNTTNQTLEAAKRNATTIRDTRKLEKNANFVSERDKLRNKITKELNMVPNNNGMFSERRGLTKGRIGIWARELKQAKTMENLKNIDNKLAKKTALRRDIENKYTKMGLTKVEKMNHRRKTMKFLNNVDARRELVEIQVKNKTNNNNNTNSVISNYNSNANSNEPKGKMKYGSRENFINAKKIELQELAKNTSTNFGRNINQMETRTNVAKLRGRIEGAVRRNKASFEPVMTNIDRIKRAGAAAEAKRKAKAELRKKNKEVAKATGRGVKATQKKRQMKRK